MTLAMEVGVSVHARYTGVSALVLGASGFIGGWMVRALSACGADVHAASRRPEATRDRLAQDSVHAHVTSVDLRQPGAVKTLIDATRPAVVFNLAGYGVDRTERDPSAMATLNTGIVADLCERLAGMPDAGWRGSRLIHAGSALEYGRVEGAIGEHTVPNPSTEYGRTKLEATRIVTHAAETGGFGAVVARLFTVYGPGEHEGRLLAALRQAARTRTRLPLTEGAQRRDFTYVEDVVEGLLRLGVSAARPGEVVNLATGRLTSVRQFAEVAADVIGLDRSALEFGALPDRPEEMWQGDVDVTRLRQLTSWLPPTDVAAGVGRTLELEHDR